jgi:hypothetical protein
VTSGVKSIYIFSKMNNVFEHKVFLKDLEVFNVESGSVVGEVVPGMVLLPGTNVRIKKAVEAAFTENAENTMRGMFFESFLLLFFALLFFRKTVKL